MTPPQPVQSLPAQFKQAMRGVAATVTVITVMADGECIGTTATAMSSLSADPPSVLVCINRSASIHRALTATSHFCVNVLHASQAAVASAFAHREKRKLGFVDGWALHPDSPPRLHGAQAALLCRRAGMNEFGSHTVFIGEIEEIASREHLCPLVYLDGKYGMVAAPEQAL